MRGQMRHCVEKGEGALVGGALVGRGDMANQETGPVSLLKTAFRKTRRGEGPLVGRGNTANQGWRRRGGRCGTTCRRSSPTRSSAGAAAPADIRVSACYLSIHPSILPSMFHSISSCLYLYVSISTSICIHIYLCLSIHCIYIYIFIYIFFDLSIHIILCIPYVMQLSYLHL